MTQENSPTRKQFLKWRLGLELVRTQSLIGTGNEVV